MSKTSDIIDQTIRLRARGMAANVTAVNALANVLRRDLKPKPITIRMRLGWYWQRVVTAWHVLRGDDIHEDCGPY